MIRERRLYRDATSWRQFQPYLPPRMRLTEGREPAEEWWSWCEADIHLDRYEAPEAPLTVVMLHGGGGCGRLLAPYGWMLRELGYEVVLPDLPGYGLTVAPEAFFSYEAWVRCAAALIEAEAVRSKRPVVVMGLSIGGYLAYLAAAQSRKAAGVIATTLADPRLPLVRDQLALHPWVNRALAPALPAFATFLGGLRVPIRWFSNMEAVTNDPDLSRLLCEDPATGGNSVPLRFMRSLLAVRPAIEPEDFDLCPVLLAQPAADRWTKLEASQPFFNRIKGRKELVLIENCGHLPIEEPGLSRLVEATSEFLQAVSIAPV